MTKDIRKLKKKADTAFSRYVRYRDGEVRQGVWQAPCITCGIWKPVTQMQAGHFVSRTCNVLRYEDMNVHAQCQGCNIWHSGEQYEYSRQIDDRYGKGTAQRLHSRRHESKKWKAEELEQIIEDAKDYIKELEEL
jgi:hypothetical protein